MLTSIGKQSGESVELVLKKKRKGCGGKDLQKRKVLSVEWKREWVMEYWVRRKYRSRIVVVFKAFSERGDPDSGEDVRPGPRGFLPRAGQPAEVRTRTLRDAAGDRWRRRGEGVHEPGMLSDLPAARLERQHGRRHSRLEGETWISALLTVIDYSRPTGVHT